MRNESRGFTTVELLVTMLLLIILVVASYLYGRSTVNPKHQNPQATSSPTTLTVSRANELGTTGTGFTIKVNDTGLAGSILKDINNLPQVVKGTYNCPNDNGDEYTLNFLDPDETYLASYTGCYFVTESGTSRVLQASPTSKAGSTFWAAIGKTTGRQL